jgi:hypothetical protein
MTNIKSLLEVQAKELTRELNEVPEIKTKKRFTPWDNGMGGYGTTAASCANSAVTIVHRNP